MATPSYNDSAIKGAQLLKTLTEAAKYLNGKFDKHGFFGNTDGKWIGAALSVDGETEVKYWKLCSFTTGSWWSLNFVADVTNARFDSNVFERKIIAINGSTPGVVSSALEIREGNNKLYSSRGYGNIIYYEISGNKVTIYIKAKFAINEGQFCRLVSVLSVNSISNLTWYQETTAGTQPENPVKFSLGYKTVKPAGSTSVPVYIGSDGNPTECTDDFVHDGDVTSTYSSTGTAPVNGTAVAAAIQDLDVSQKTAKKVTHARCCAGITTSTVASATKRIALSSLSDYGNGSLYAIYFENGNSVNPVQEELWFWIYPGSDTSGNNPDLKIRVYGSEVSRIAAGKTYLFVQRDATSGLHLVGEVNSTIDFTARNNGVYYDFVKNNGVSVVVDAYPYQPPSNTTDTFLGQELAYVNTIVNGLIQPFAVSKSGSTYGYSLNWANYPDTKWDFIDVTIRFSGWYQSSSSRDESLTIEPLKGTAGGYAAANLPELSASLRIISDDTKRNFGFTINRRYSYKEFLNRVGGQTSALSYGITFATKESSSAEQHKVYISDIWTRAVYYGQRS